MRKKHSATPTVNAPPPPGRVWLALCRRNLDASWALLASSIPDLIIRQGILLPVPIHFEFGSGTALGWREWVDNELSDTGFMGYCSKPVFWRPSFYLTACPTSRTSTTFATWYVGGVPPPIPSSSPAANSPLPLKTWPTSYSYPSSAMLILPL